MAFNKNRNCVIFTLFLFEINFDLCFHLTFVVDFVIFPRGSDNRVIKIQLKTLETMKIISDICHKR